MPVFDLAGLGGIETQPISLADANDTASVDVRFTDGVLWMPPSQHLTLTASFRNQGNERTRLQLIGAFSPAAAIAGNQLQLENLSLSIPFVGATAPTLDITPTRPVNADGRVRWVLPSLAPLLGISELALTLALDNSATGTRFRLTLAAPVTIPNAFVEMTDGSVGVHVIPSAQALEISLSAVGGLTTEGRAKARALLEPVFGPGDPLASLPANVSLRRRFHLSSGAVPNVALPASPAQINVVPAWSTGSAPPLQLPLPDGLELDIGLPELSLAFDETSNTPTQFIGRLRDCVVDFPQLGALPAFSLGGALEIGQQGPQTVLRLIPAVPATIDLPGFIRFFLSRLRWLADAADLGQLSEQLSLSLGELEWEQLFRGLLDSAGGVPPGFATAFGSLLTDAIGLLVPATPLERVFLIAFSAFETVADDTYDIVWDALFALAGGANAPADVNEIVVGVLQLLSDAPEMLNTALQAMLASPGLDLPGVLTKMLDTGISLLDEPRDFLRLLMQTLAAAIGAIDPSTLARVIIDLAVANNDASSSISVPRLLGAPSLIPLPDLTLPPVPALLMSALGGLVASIHDFVPRLPTGDSLYEVMRTISGALGEELTAFGVSDLFGFNAMVNLIDAIIDYCESDLERELMLLRTSRIPILGAAVTLVAVVKAARTNALPWWDLLGVNLEHDPAYNTIVLPAPGTPNPDNPSTKRKYLIVSDVHRDKAADDRGFLNAGSIDHFAHNHDLYLRILDWADQGGYTVIEAGDSEELWYVRDFDAYGGPAAEMDQIINTNQAVYNKLRALQHKGRHVRIKGNHDSYLDQPAVRSRLDTAMSQPPNPFPFEMYDFAIIQGVKTLQDNWFASDSEIDDLLSGNLTVGDYLDASLQRLRDLVIGLDSTRYHHTKPMIVGHGHQWDFWNCRENQLIGKMLSNLVGVPADQILDPFVDARGLAWAGEPAVNFATVASQLPVFNNWLATREAVKFAHKIQHQSSADRMLIDDAMFGETIAALSATLGFEVDQPDASGVHRSASDYTDPVKRFGALRFNQLCLGHTHFPQSQPFWDIEALLDPLGILDAVRVVTRELFFGWEPTANFMRALYYNTGTAGWHEGVVWGLEISELGHARLVFWTHNSLGPETMDWELTEMAPDQRAQLEQRIDALGNELGTLLQTFAGRGLTPSASAAVPATLVAGATVQSAGDVQLDIGALTGAGSVPAELALARVQATLGQVIVAAAMQEVNAAPRTYTIRVPVPFDAWEPIEGVSNLLAQISGLDSAEIPKLACGWLNVVRNLPFFGGFESRREMTSVDERVFWVIVSLLFQLPSAQVPSSKLPLVAQATFDGDALVVTMTVG